MPYISMGRANLKPNPLFAAMGSGELNYQITALIIDYVHTHGESYATYNDVIGVLESAKLELWRRKVGPYEQAKMEENGDVWWP